MKNLRKMLEVDQLKYRKPVARVKKLLLKLWILPDFDISKIVIHPFPTNKPRGYKAIFAMKLSGHYNKVYVLQCNHPKGDLYIKNILPCEGFYPSGAPILKGE